MRVAFLLALFLAGLAVARGDWQEGAAGTKFLVELTDGSQVVGTPSVTELKMTTDYADVAIPLTKLRGVKLSGSDSVATASMGNGDQLRGHLAAKAVELKTAFGPVSIPIAYITNIQVNGGVALGEAFPDGLVLHYAFASDEGDRVSDSSGNHNDGAVKGATYTEGPKAGTGAMSFSGEKQLVVIGNPVNLQLQDLSIVAWIKRSNAQRVTAEVDGKALIVGYGRDGYGLGMYQDGRLAFTKTLDDDTVATEIHDQDFHQVAVTKQGSKVVFYVDGTAYPATGYDPGFQFHTDLAIGGIAEEMSHCFLGEVGELEVFNRGLTADEVKGIYDAQK